MTGVTSLPLFQQAAKMYPQHTSGDSNRYFEYYPLRLRSSRYNQGTVNEARESMYAIILLAMKFSQRVVLLFIVLVLFLAS